MDIKKTISFALSTAIIIGILSYRAAAPDDISTVYASSDNKCGDNLTWELDNGTLTISGTGNMYSYGCMCDYGGTVFPDQSPPPWWYYTGTGNIEYYKAAMSITNIIIDEKVSSICAFAFENLRNLKSITFLSPDCEIPRDSFTICNIDYIYQDQYDHDKFGREIEYKGVIKGYKGSTAEDFANRWKYQFEVLDAESPVTSTTASTQAVTTTTTTATSSTVTDTTAETDLHLSADELTMKPGQQYKISANQSELTYKSSNTDIAIVSSKGVITAMSEGDAVITVYNKDFDATSITVKVKNKLPIYGDGKVTVADAVAILQFIGNRDKYGLTADSQANADVDGVAGITGKDALVIQQVDAGIYKTEDLPLQVNS